MGKVTVTVNGRDYDVACDDGQEDHVLRLAGYVDSRVADLTGNDRRREGDSLVLIMASLVVADELADARAEIDRLKSESASGEGDAETSAAEFLSLVERIENVAERLNAP